MPFVLLPAGTFRMGTPPSEKGREAQERLHQVTIARAFYLGVHEVTQAQWTTVMGDNPSTFSGCAACPVEQITYLDVERFVARLNAISAWRGFRLPTEAEGEYACRAGGTAAYGATEAIDRTRANYDSERTTPGGSFQPNRWGLFDMAGNVWEWTADDYAPYAGVPAPDSPTFSPDRKVIRGGS